MDEFNNRIDAQRQILRCINSKKWKQEDLFGLSNKAIRRWVSINQIKTDCSLVNLISIVSSKLFFLANKSQEQISEEYKINSSEIVLLSKEIENEIERKED